MGASLCADPEELAAMGRSYGIRTQKKPEGRRVPIRLLCIIRVLGGGGYPIFPSPSGEGGAERRMREWKFRL